MDNRNARPPSWIEIRQKMLTTEPPGARATTTGMTVSGDFARGR